MNKILGKHIIGDMEENIWLALHKIFYDDVNNKTSREVRIAMRNETWGEVDLEINRAVRFTIIEGIKGYGYYSWKAR